MRSSSASSWQSAAGCCQRTAGKTKRAAARRIQTRTFESWSGSLLGSRREEAIEEAGEEAEEEAEAAGEARQAAPPRAETETTRGEAAREKGAPLPRFGG